ncbi:MAG: hypothetical protein F6K00_23815 [Leptolyngbya sp. SIOISBB]|nr:hypothetical protein [Leptolyngbya sp. SIOISBB]
MKPRKSPEPVTVANESIPAPSEGELELNDWELRPEEKQPWVLKARQIYVFQEVSGPIQWVDVSPQLSETLGKTDPSLHCQAYLAEGIGAIWEQGFQVSRHQSGWHYSKSLS